MDRYGRLQGRWIIESLKSTLGAKLEILAPLYP